jgi:hypothetical protein
MTATLHPYQVLDQAKRDLVRASSDSQDALYDAIQLFADALFDELVQVREWDSAKADLAIRGTLVKIGEEMAHDWQYGPLDD